MNLEDSVKAAVHGGDVRAAWRVTTVLQELRGMTYMGMFNVFRLYCPDLELVDYEAIMQAVDSADAALSQDRRIWNS